MHGHIAYDVFLRQIAGFLGTYYLLLAVMNGVAAFLLWQDSRQRTLFRLPVVEFPVTAAFLWLLASLFFLLVSPLAYSGDPLWMGLISLPEPIRAGINRLMNPTIYTLGSLVLLGVAFLLRRILVIPWVAWLLLNV